MAVLRTFVQEGSYGTGRGRFGCLLWCWAITGAWRRWAADFASSWRRETGYKEGGMRRGSTLRGVFVLMVAMMMIAAGSAYVAVIDFDDASLSEGDVVDDWGAVHEYLKITPWDDANTDAVERRQRDQT